MYVPPEVMLRVKKAAEENAETRSYGPVETAAATGRVQVPAHIQAMARAYQAAVESRGPRRLTGGEAVTLLLARNTDAMRWHHNHDTEPVRLTGAEAQRILERRLADPGHMPGRFLTPKQAAELLAIKRQAWRREAYLYGKGG